MKKLYLLRPHTKWKPWYDKVFGFVIRAESEKEARALAESRHGDESRNEPIWLNSLETSCEELTAEGVTEIIIRDFAAA